MHAFGDAANAEVNGGLDALVIIEDSIKLRMFRTIVSVVLVIIESDEVVCHVTTAEGFVGERSEAKVNHHSSSGILQHRFCLYYVVSELNSISEKEQPGLSEVRNMRLNGPIFWIVNINYLLAH